MIILLRILFILLLVLPLMGANQSYYVDKDTTNITNDGKSWATAWKLFTGIEWSATEDVDKVDPGDAIYLSDGTYTKRWTMVHPDYGGSSIQDAASGTSGLPITLTAGRYSPSDNTGHDGEVIFDHSTLPSMYIKGYDWLTIKNFSFQPTPNDNVFFISNADNIVVDYCTFSSWTRSIFSQNNTNLIIQNCTIDGPEINNPDYQTDGIYSQNGNNLLIDDCDITIRNNGDSDTAHNDCIQLVGETNPTIRNCFLQQGSNITKVQNASLLQIEVTHGLLLVYNNVLKGGINADQSTGLGATQNASTDGTIQFFNNTVYYPGKSAFFTKHSTGNDSLYTGITITNNIFYSFKASEPYIGLFTGKCGDVTNPHIDPTVVDYNLYYSADGATDLVSYGGGWCCGTGSGKVYTNPIPKTWAEFINDSPPLVTNAKFGFEANGLNADPRLHITGTFNLWPDSPCLGKGKDLTSLGISGLNVDKEGTARPNGSNWDMGAFYTPPPSTTTTTPAVETSTTTTVISDPDAELTDILKPGLTP